MKYEEIKNAYAKEMVNPSGVEMTMRKDLSEVELRNKVIFQATEQGHRYKSNDEFLCYHHEHK